MLKKEKYYIKAMNRAEDSMEYELDNSYLGEDETKNVIIEVERIAKKEIERQERNISIGIVNMEEANEIINLNKKVISITQKRLETYRTIK